jgi:hypothetical protein
VLISYSSAGWLSQASNTGILLHLGTRLEVLSIVFNISKDCTTFVFGFKQSKKETLTLKIKVIQSLKTPATLNSTYNVPEDLNFQLKAYLIINIFTLGARVTPFVCALH